MRSVAACKDASETSNGGQGGHNGGDKDNFTSLTSLNWQVHAYGDVSPDIHALCDQRKLALHVFPWRSELRRSGLRRNAVYLVRPDGYVALADPEGSASAVAFYLDAHKIVPMR